MSKLTKIKSWLCRKIEAGKAYSLKKKLQSLVKEITTTKFDASVDIDVRLGVDPRKANQMVRGVVSLPHGTGKQVRFLYYVHLTKKLKLKKLVLTMLVWMNILKKLKVDGLILMLSSLCLYHG